MERVQIKPAGGNRDNKVATTLRMLAVVVWIVGFCIGYYAGYKLGEVQGYFGKSDFSWTTAFVIWGITFVSGLMPYAFSEIIYLLQSLNNNSYFIEGFEETHSDRKKRGKDSDRRIDDTAATTSSYTDTQDGKQEYLDDYDYVEVDAFVNKIANMTSSYEIKKYVDSLKIYGDPIVTNELMDIVNTSWEVERSYGNNYSTCMKKICKLYGYEYEDDSRESKPALDEPTETKDDEEPMNSAYIFCTNCGNKIDEPDAVFCPACGNKIFRA